MVRGIEDARLNATGPAKGRTFAASRRDPPECCLIPGSASMRGWFAGHEAIIDIARQRQMLALKQCPPISKFEHMKHKQ
jgi:hypothetical protein